MLLLVVDRTPGLSVPRLLPLLGQGIVFASQHTTEGRGPERMPTITEVRRERFALVLYSVDSYTASCVYNYRYNNICRVRHVVLQLDLNPTLWRLFSAHMRAVDLDEPIRFVDCPLPNPECVRTRWTHDHDVSVYTRLLSPPRPPRHYPCSLRRRRRVLLLSRCYLET